jgi:hypothetical protein
MPGPEDRLAEVKDALMDIWAPNDEPIGNLKAVANHEPLQAPNLPLLTLMTRGFRRAGLETPDVEGTRIQDPLMGRRWVWRLWVRVWVGLVSDAQAAQNELDVLIPQVVAALEADRSLGGVAVDAAMSSGDAAIVRPQQGQPTLMLTCDLAVETEEPLS